MDSNNKNSIKRPVPDAVAKLVPLKSRTDSERSELSSTRSRLRNALPLGQQQTREHNRPHLSRQAVKETVQSALELRPPINFDHILRRDKKSTPSRRNSGPDNARAGEQLSKLQETTRALKEHVDATDVHKSREDNVKREEELRSALQTIEDQGLKSTQELDSTYYILLEKAEALRNVVSSMQKLAEESRQFHMGFKEQSKEMQTSIDKSVDGYANFDDQERSIGALLKRLDAHKTRTTALNERLDDAKRRAEVCERRILHAQAQRRKRWSIAWAVLFAIAVIILGVMAYRGGMGAQTLVPPAINNEALDFVSPFLSSLKARPSDDPYLQDLFKDIT